MGEILLVVIGILIAVQLNNLNQKRISAARIEVLLDKVEEDLIHNIKVTNGIIDYYHKSDSLTKKVLYNQVTKEDYYSIIEWRQDDQCIQKYVEKRNGYLIIE